MTNSHVGCACFYIVHLHVARYCTLQCFHVCSCVRFFMKCIEAADMAAPLIVCYSSSLARNYNRRCHTEQYFQYFLEFPLGYKAVAALVSKSVFLRILKKIEKVSFCLLAYIYTAISGLSGPYKE